ncbi:MAG TPA: acetyl-CoA carboxylase carboxyltransferase subunit alpha [Candidatus Ozemobacteraceae bacterium]|nr:acetyl-CoA carboxylase carboxyltransferase subunit alpha [Candidatus Ozemobacteraceae bacterium]HQG28150.1 acetyl-CoA carboxylase carboxyltransferase subunit alpha [Candidatus Ozemobacteraceae bacterium]
MARDLEFERPILELEKQLIELQETSVGGHIDLSKEINAIADKIRSVRAEIFKGLEPWQVTQVARHIDRPSTLDYAKLLCGDEFVEMHGDRLFGDDPAIVGGPALIGGHRVVLIGHQKGHDTDENLHRNFGMPHPEGYRKALRLMKFAQRFNLPVVVLIDTPGAFPGIGAEERGQSEAIARNLAEMSQISVPILCFVIGEGGSGGALALGVGDRVFMLEYAIYSVISAEGCAAILWKDAAKAKDAAAALKIRSENLLELGIIDGILPEPLGGAHREPQVTAEAIRRAIDEHLPRLLKMSPAELIEKRYAKFRAMGQFRVAQDAIDA